MWVSWGFLSIWTGAAAAEPMVWRWEEGQHRRFLVRWSLDVRLESEECDSPAWAWARTASDNDDVAIVMD